MSSSRVAPAAGMTLKECFPRVWNWDEEHRPMSLEQQDLHIAERDRAHEDSFPAPARDYHDRNPESRVSCLGREQEPWVALAGTLGLLTHWPSPPSNVSSGSNHSRTMSYGARHCLGFW